MKPRHHEGPLICSFIDAAMATLPFLLPFHFLHQKAKIDVTFMALFIHPHRIPFCHLFFQLLKV